MLLHVTPKSKPILCGCLYRPPQQHDFYNVLDNICASSGHLQEYETVLLGDFNTDVLIKTNSSLLTSFKRFVDVHNFRQLICHFTRICTQSSTAIDLILVYDSGKINLE